MVKIEPTLFKLLQEYYALIRLDERTQEEEDALSAIRKLSKTDHQLRALIIVVEKYFSYKE